MTTAEIIQRLDAKRSGDGWKFRCPAHEDKTASGSLSEGENGATLLCCHAGCATESIAAKIGLKLADLFNGEHRMRRNGSSQIVATYDYRDETGSLLFQVCRFNPKDFRQRKPDPTAQDGWTWNTKGVRRVPFRLPELLAAVAEQRPVFNCEGEKDVLAAVNAGFAATCNPGGAGKWQQEFTTYFRSADVFIIADKDEPGRKHAHRVAKSLHNVAGSVHVVELPDVNGQKVKDAADFFAAGGEAAEFDAICHAVPEWTPAPLVETPDASASDFDRYTAEMRGEIIGWLISKEPALKIRQEVAKLVVATLAKIGRFYFHAGLRDFDSAMFFNAHDKRLARIRSDAFGAWLSEWVGINRAESHFRFIVADVETSALSGPHTTGILPESYWASRIGAIYLSNGDGRAVKITADGVQLVDNGTDGVLFAAGKTLSPWNYTTARDAFETCRLFRDAHCSAGHGKDLLRLWIYSLPTNPRTKPPLCASGDVGSGKTRTIKGIAELYGLPFIAQKVEEEAESNFWPCVNEGGIYCLDNADTKCRWLADALANAATDGCSQRRRLYTNSETVTLRARAWLAVTTANPTFASDAGLADRLLLVRMGRHDGDTSDGALSDEIARHRDAGLSHIAETLRRALDDHAPVPNGLNARHPDFAAFAVRIGRALGSEVEAVAALRAAESDKSKFCMENDAIGSALLGYLQHAGQFNGTAAELAPHLIAIDSELEGRLSAKRLSKRLSAIWPHLKNTLAKCAKEPDRNGVSHFAFQSPAGFAGFQTDFPKNPLAYELHRHF